MISLVTASETEIAPLNYLFLRLSNVNTIQCKVVYYLQTTSPSLKSEVLKGPNVLGLQHSDVVQPCSSDSVSPWVARSGLSSMVQIGKELPKINMKYFHNFPQHQAPEKKLTPAPTVKYHFCNHPTTTFHHKNHQKKIYPNPKHNFPLNLPPPLQKLVLSQAREKSIF